MSAHAISNSSHRSLGTADERAEYDNILTAVAREGTRVELFGASFGASDEATRILLLKPKQDANDAEQAECSFVWRSSATAAKVMLS